MLSTLIKGACAGALVLGAAVAQAGGEAGPIRLRDQGHFYVGLRELEVEGNPQAGPFGAGGVGLYGQMYVGFQLVENPTQKYPLILVHGGGGQSTDYMSTPDGRDGWLDYFLAAGFDVYFVDRPAHGRSPNSTEYGELGGPTGSGLISLLAASSQWPGDATASDDPSLLQHLASSEPGPTVDAQMLKDNFAELLERVGPAIVVTHSAGGPSGWLAMDAKPDMVKAVVAIEAAGGLNQLPLTWEPTLAEGESLPVEQVPPTEEGKAPCTMQPEDSVHSLPNFSGIPIMGILAPESIMFTPNYHCTLDFINQAGGDATLVKLEDEGIEGNGHFMQAARNNGEIAQLMIEWMETVE